MGINKNTKNKNIIIIIDILIYLAYGIIGFFLMLFFLITLEEGKFENETFNFIIMIIGFIHILIGILCSVLFYIKERTKKRIRINKPLMIYNSIMTISPYVILSLLELAGQVLSV